MNKKVQVPLLIFTALIAFTAYRLTSETTTLPREVHGLFQAWAKKHGKEYATPEELLFRLTTFYQNSLLIDQLHKEHPNLKFNHNMFSDLTQEEFGAKSGSTSDRDEQKEEINKNPTATPKPLETSESPNLQENDFVDWSDKLRTDLPTVKPDCINTVGAMAFIDQVSFEYEKKYRYKPDLLSSQFILDCVFTNYECNDVNHPVYAQSIYNKISYQPFPTAQNYQGEKTGKYGGSCKFPTSNRLNQSIKKPVIVVDYKKKYGSDKMLVNMLDEGPVIAIQMIFSLRIVQFYSAGLVSTNQCDVGERGQFSPLVVGYSSGGSKGRYSDPYFKLRWYFGDSYGEDGYMYFEREIGSEDTDGPCKIYRYNHQYFVN